MSILVDENTTFIIQGITGREAVTMAREVLDYGSKLIGGVTPGRKGRNVHGVPVEDTVRAFTEQQRVDASVVSVPPAFAADAVNEAIESGIKLIVVVTERIPRKQVAQFVEYAQQENVRLIGPNCLGIISPGKAKIGGMGGAIESCERAFTPGSIGVMSRSGGMTVEISDTNELGVYLLRNNEVVFRSFAVNPDTRESDLDSFPLEQAGRLLGEEVPVVFMDKVVFPIPPFGPIIEITGIQSFPFF